MTCKLSHGCFPLMQFTKYWVIIRANVPDIRCQDWSLAQSKWKFFPHVKTFTCKMFCHGRSSRNTTHHDHCPDGLKHNRCMCILVHTRVVRLAGRILHILYILWYSELFLENLIMYEFEIKSALYCLDWFRKVYWFQCSSKSLGIVAF
jgi:hypothetical protein